MRTAEDKLKDLREAFLSLRRLILKMNKVCCKQIKCTDFRSVIQFIDESLAKTL